MNADALKTSAVLLGTLALLATQPGASCVSDSNGTSSGTSSRTSGGTSGGTARAPSESVEDANAIPQRAEIVAEGRGALDHTADADGQLYVQDLKDEATVLTRRVTRGQTINVVPDENRIAVDGDTVSKRDLKRDHTHRVYLLRDRRFEDRNGRDNDGGDDLPSGAQVMGEGRNRELSFTPGRDGRAFIYDVERRRVVANVAVGRGKRFVFSPGADRATLDGKRVLSRDFDPTRNYRLYFSR